MIHFTADTHFGHANVLSYCPNRKFPGPFEMDRGLIEAWNSVVQDGDEVYHLGDVGLCKPSWLHNILWQLNGRIHLVRGNHDKAIKGEIARRFVWVKDYYTMEIDGQRLVMMHYPLLTWHGAHRGTWMLHGHSHGNLRDAGITRIDVGVDMHPNLAPWSWPEIGKRMKGRTYSVVDHHGKREG